MKHNKLKIKTIIFISIILLAASLISFTLIKIIEENEGWKAPKEFLVLYTVFVLTMLPISYIYLFYYTTRRDMIYCSKCGCWENKELEHICCIPYTFVGHTTYL